MAITEEDITLENMLKKTCPEAFPEDGKLKLPNGEWLSIVSTLRMAERIEKLINKIEHSRVSNMRK